MNVLKVAFGCLLLVGCGNSASSGDPSGGGFGNAGFGGGGGGNVGNGGDLGNGGFVGGGGNVGGGGFVGGGGTISGGGTIGGGGIIGSGGLAGSGGEGAGGSTGGIGGVISADVTPEDPTICGGAGVPTTQGACGSTSLLPVPTDPSIRGPWAVGVRTVTIGRLTAEVVYPAAAGSEQGKPVATYDIRDWLPKNPVQPANFTPIADSESPAVTSLCGALYRDLPIDAGHGPYPVVILMHGTSSFRIASGTLMAHWASRGFVVVAADYPGLMLADQLCTAGCNCTPSGTADYKTDIQTQITALTAASGDLAFLGGHVDMGRIGLSGHSVGGCTVAGLAADTNVQVVIPLSSAAATPTSASLKSTMYISGMADTVFTYVTGASGIGNVVCDGSGLNTVTTAYTSSTGTKKRLVGVTDGGHLLPTDLCQTNADGNNAIQVLHNHHYCAVDSVAVIGLPALFDCGKNGFDWQVGMRAVDYASTAALEETLMCQDRTAQFANIKTAQPKIGDFQEAK